MYQKKYVFSYCIKIKKPTAHAFTYNDWRIKGRSLFKKTRNEDTPKVPKTKKNHWYSLQKLKRKTVQGKRTGYYFDIL